MSEGEEKSFLFLFLKEYSGGKTVLKAKHSHTLK